LGYYPIHAAAEKGHNKIVALLVKAGASVDSRTAAEFEQEQNTPLLLAVAGKHMPTVKVLIEAGADVNAKSLQKNTPLGNAIKVTDQAMIEYLFQHGAKAEQAHLKLAVHRDAVEVVQFLLNRGLQLEHSSDMQSGSLLYHAIGHNKPRMVEFLIGRGVPVNQSSGEFAEPPVVQACRQRKWDIAKLLLCNGADPNLSSAHNAHALNYAVRCEGTVITKLLLENGAKPNSLDFEDKTPLDWAVENQNRVAVELLISHGASVPKRLVGIITRRFGKAALMTDRK
jgi:ankyrin repeat protein